uniref:hypothetical protein n=1 Tax=Clostridium sp. NkU-1 TaxID=1095009 RepID=UPI000A423446
MEIPVNLESNGVPDNRDNLGMYPQIRYDRKRLKKLAFIFYGLLFFVGAVLGVINYATYSGSLWSIIAIGLWLIRLLRSNIPFYAMRIWPQRSYCRRWLRRCF